VIVALCTRRRVNILQEKGEKEENNVQNKAQRIERASGDSTYNSKINVLITASAAMTPTTTNGP